MCGDLDIKAPRLDLSRLLQSSYPQLSIMAYPYYPYHSSVCPTGCHPTCHPGYPCAYGGPPGDSLHAQESPADGAGYYDHRFSVLGGTPYAVPQGISHNTFYAHSDPLSAAGNNFQYPSSSELDVFLYYFNDAVKSNITHIRNNLPGEYRVLHELFNRFLRRPTPPRSRSSMHTLSRHWGSALMGWQMSLSIPEQRLIRILNSTKSEDPSRNKRIAIWWEV